MQTTDMNKPCWEMCDMCEDFICNIHSTDEHPIHVHDCECFCIDWWTAMGLYPYVTTIREYREALENGSKRSND